MKNKKKTLAWARCGAALVAAVVLLAVTGFAFVDLIDGPAVITDGSELTKGAYIQTDLTYVMSFCGVEKNGAGDITAYYAAAPIGNKFVLVRFDADEHGKVASLEDATTQYLKGETTSLPFYLTVTGTGVPMEEAQGALLAQWFNENGEWMLSSGVIQTVENFGDYLCTVQLNANRVGSMSQNAAIVLSCIAAALVLYALAELFFILDGAYDRKPKKVKKPTPKPEIAPASAAVGQAEIPAPAAVSVPENLPAPEEDAQEETPFEPEEIYDPTAEDGNV